MTLEELEHNCPNIISIKDAAEIMGVTQMFLRLALRQQKFDFGTAVEGKRWMYYINTVRFIQYIKGYDMKNG